jgi:hypothetical protein
MPVRPDTATAAASEYVDTTVLGIEGHSVRPAACRVKPRWGYSSSTGAVRTP